MCTPQVSCPVGAASDGLTGASEPSAARRTLTVLTSRILESSALRGRLDIRRREGKGLSPNSGPCQYSARHCSRRRQRTSRIPRISRSVRLLLLAISEFSEGRGTSHTDADLDRAHPPL